MIHRYIHDTCKRAVDSCAATVEGLSGGPYRFQMDCLATRQGMMADYIQSQKLRAGFLA